ncbi:MAG TPA: 3-hydroxyacyl-CoA dehydrogenase [Gammaproteobacteria bacterium]|nr:3-hydroxyacyl-CoA dehydrogenase [Gammaproteobacteria bacterium]
MTGLSPETTVLVIGAGIMGAGIAQVAAQAGHPVRLFDSRETAAEGALEKLAATFDKLVAKGKFSDDEARAILDRIVAIDSLDGGAEAGLAVEAVVEDLDIKRGLLRDLESIVAADCLLATNTSSISVTALANGLQHPGRLVGMHFFNPVPLMKLVEVVSGLQTEVAAAETVFELAGRWGKTAVHARSTPGFIVNRIARPFYAETLALLQVRAATPEVLDACLRGAGFRMGPCELMDLIGHDTNFAVTRSVYEANFQDKRYTPSLVQRELVDGGLLGRKSGRGFYSYDGDEISPITDFPATDSPPSTDGLAVRGRGPVAERMIATLKSHGCHFEQVPDSKWIGLQAGSARLRLTDGRCAAEHGRDVAVFDLPLGSEPGTALAWAHSGRADAQWVEDAPRWLALFGFNPQLIADAPGLVVARTVAMLINEAADAVQQGVCSEQDADAAMKLGVNYPAGPFEWLDAWDAGAVIDLLERLDTCYRGERYRASPWLRQRAWNKTR